MMQHLKQKEIGNFRIQYYYDSVRLMYNDRIIMSNSNYQHITNKQIIQNAYGDVLILGLGLGYIVMPIQQKQCVKSIIIVEKYQQVIDLVASQLPLNNKVSIIKANALRYRPGDNQKFDTLWCDLYGINVKKLKEWFIKNFSKYKRNENSYINAWTQIRNYKEEIK